MAEYYTAQRDVDRTRPQLHLPLRNFLAGRLDPSVASMSISTMNSSEKPGGAFGYL